MFECKNPECETPWVKHYGHGLCRSCYYKNYYQKNKVKILAQLKEFRSIPANAYKIKEYNRKYREQNREGLRLLKKMKKRSLR